MADVSEILAEIEAALEKATPGPWAHRPVMSRNGEYLVRDAVVAGRVEVVEETARKEDAAYIAACNPVAIRALVEEVRRLQGRDEECSHAWALHEELKAKLASLREPAGEVGEIRQKLLGHIIEKADARAAADLLTRQAAEIEEAKRVDALSVETIMTMNREIVAAEASLREAVEEMRRIDSCIYNDNGDVTWSPLAVRVNLRALIDTLEAKTND